MGTIPRAQARISSTIQLLPEVGRTSTIPRGPARTLSTIHLLLEVGRTSTTPRELARTSSITHHHQRAMMTRKTTNQNSPADTILQLLVLQSATALFLYQVQPMLLDTTTMESTPYYSCWCCSPQRHCFCTRSSRCCWILQLWNQLQITAVGAAVRNGTVSVPGPADAVGYYNYGINS